MFTETQIVYHQYQDWLLAILMINICFLTYTYYLKPIYYTRLANSLVNINATTKLNKEKNSLTNRLSFYLNISFFINATLFLYLHLQHIDIDFGIKHPMLKLIIILTVLILLVYLRIALYHIVGWTTLHPDIQIEYNFYWMNLNKTLGIVLIPGIFCMMYLPLTNISIITNIYLVVFILLYLAKLFRGIQISVRNNLSLFSIILYLCALELTPIGILIKYLISK